MNKNSRFHWKPLFVVLAGTGFLALVLAVFLNGPPQSRGRPELLTATKPADFASTSGLEVNWKLNYEPRFEFDTSGFYLIGAMVPKWSGRENLATIANIWNEAVQANKVQYQKRMSDNRIRPSQRIEAGMTLALIMHFEADPDAAYECLTSIRNLAISDSSTAKEWLSSIIYLQGVTGLRCGENDNCVMCRGEGACVLPIRGEAIHENRHGSELAVKHFNEYLKLFPDDVEVRWLLNLAYMTLGQHPEGVDEKYLITLDSTEGSPVGEFEDVAFQVGANRFNQAGGAIMDDFDNDGLLDITTTSFDPSAEMSMLRNLGNGTYASRPGHVGATEQLGGLYCVQADYNNDGFLDIFIPRGAWLLSPLRPSLLENNGDGTFRDVTERCGLLSPANSNSATWADFDNDGLLDLFVCCERQKNRLYRGQGDGTFTDVAEDVGVAGQPSQYTKGAAWIDFDNDGDCDLFVNHYQDNAQIFRNDNAKGFVDVSERLGVDGPQAGFSCWCWDYDNDGWQDIFATCYDLDLKDVVAGLRGEDHSLRSGRLYRNLGGTAFQDQAASIGLEDVYGTMGSNFGDFDGDGFLDMYLGTGEPKLETLVPNRMFRNEAGRRFADITWASRTGHLQKGHGVSVGDWDRDGDVDLFVETGGAGNGDRFNNVLFQNPGNENAWVNLQLIGMDSNRSAIGTRIRVSTGGDVQEEIYRHVTSGSSFGANPLEQHVGLGKAARIKAIEVEWLGSGTKQIFRDIPLNSAIVIREGVDTIQFRGLQTIELPAAKEQLE